MRPPEVLGEVLTHTFASKLPGYVGWHWAVTLARFQNNVERRRTVKPDRWLGRSRRQTVTTSVTA